MSKMFGNFFWSYSIMSSPYFYQIFEEFSNIFQNICRVVVPPTHGPEQRRPHMYRVIKGANTQTGSERALFTLALCALLPSRNPKKRVPKTGSDNERDPKDRSRVGAQKQGTESLISFRSRALFIL